MHSFCQTFLIHGKENKENIKVNSLVKQDLKFDLSGLIFSHSNEIIILVVSNYLYVILHPWYTSLFFSYNHIYGHLRWPFFSPFGYGRVPELSRITNIWNCNNSEGMTIIQKKWQKSGKNDSITEGMTIMRKEWHRVFFWKK